MPIYKIVFRGSFGGNQVYLGAASSVNAAKEVVPAEQIISAEKISPEQLVDEMSDKRRANYWLGIMKNQPVLDQPLTFCVLDAPEDEVGKEGKVRRK